MELSSRETTEVNEFPTATNTNQDAKAKKKLEIKEMFDLFEHHKKSPPNEVNKNNNNQTSISKNPNNLYQKPVTKITMAKIEDKKVEEEESEEEEEEEEEDEEEEDLENEEEEINNEEEEEEESTVNGNGVLNDLKNVYTKYKGVKGINNKNKLNMDMNLISNIENGEYEKIEKSIKTTTENTDLKDWEVLQDDSEKNSVIMPQNYLNQKNNNIQNIQNYQNMQNNKNIDNIKNNKDNQKSNNLPIEQIYVGAKQEIDDDSDEDIINKIVNKSNNYNQFNQSNQFNKLNIINELPKNIENSENLQNTSKKISNFEMINKEPSLLNYESFIQKRISHFEKQLKEIEKNEGSLESFSHSYLNMGIHCLPNDVITYREYAPGAKGISLFGEFNKWNKDEFWAIQNNYGCWELKIPGNENGPIIKHNQKVKCNVIFQNGNWMTRNPIWSNYLLQDQNTFIYDNIFYNPEKKYKWQHPEIHIKKPKSLKIYEVHIGISSNKEKISTYKEFANNIIPRIKKLGYTAIQLMAIMEHSDYSSFGFLINNIFAISSRFGTPEDFKYLIDVAHSYNLFVIMNITHNCISTNADNGFNYWDGTDYLYFHSGERGNKYEKRFYNFNSYETLRLLLSNCIFYSEIYHIDGFKFDNVTSIIYKNHGFDTVFNGNYKEYFNDNFDEDGAVYLMLANYIIHKINPEAITIAEDFSEIPGLCFSIKDGGFGFDYRINNKVNKKWIDLLQNYKDENWNMENIIYTLTNRKYNEKYICFCEEYYGKSIAMWLFDKEIYFNMGFSQPETIIINRGMSLHKMIRMLTFALGGEGYLNFMGNEFGHPEWIEFPKKENGFSYARCCRKWDLCDNKLLRYKFLYNWDVAMNKLEEVFYFINSQFQYVSTKNENEKIIVFEKGDLLFVFNFHTENSYENYIIGTKWGSNHRTILDSDEKVFFGKERLKYGHEHRFPIIKKSFNKRPYSLSIYIPSRTCMVLIAKENESKYDLTKFAYPIID